MKTNILLVTLIGLLSSTGCMAAEKVSCESGEKEVVMQAVRQASGSGIKSCMNDLNRSGAASDVLKELDAFLTTPNGQSIDDLGRMAIRNTILQGHRNGVAKIDPSQYYIDAESVLTDGGEAAKAEAISVLAMRDDDRSASLLSEFIDQPNSERLFKSAVVSLAMMCVESAEAALERAASDGRLSESRRKFLNETREQTAGFKHGTGWCQ